MVKTPLGKLLEGLLVEPLWKVTYYLSILHHSRTSPLFFRHQSCVPMAGNLQVELGGRTRKLGISCCTSWLWLVLGAWSFETPYVNVNNEVQRAKNQAVYGALVHALLQDNDFVKLKFDNDIVIHDGLLCDAG